MYAHIILFKKIGEFDQALTYGIPEDLRAQVQAGDLVRIPFRNQSKLGIVTALLGEMPTGFDLSKLKFIHSKVQDIHLPDPCLKIADFVARYYQTSFARALKLFIPQKLWNAKEATLKKMMTLALKVAPLPENNLDFTLTSFQQGALEKAKTSLRPLVLHGVTGSGKTEVYMRLIFECLKSGRQAALLVPEIALTPQMMDRVTRVFGGKVALFHSRLSDQERLKSWLRIQRGQAAVALGSRSTLFAPFSNLGIIILDEEHEWTYKQEQAPYYLAHTVAEMMAQLHGAKLILGSATPSAETYYKVKTGRFDFFEIPERINGKALPLVRVVDLREEFHKKNFSIFSEALKNKIEDRLQKKEQVILFLNHRGHSSAVVCRDCGFTELCPSCDIALKYHRGGVLGRDLLMCHFCTFTKAPPLMCPSCQSPFIRHVGIGTQKVEEEVRRLFPQARVVRADHDSTKLGEGFDPIYRDFLGGKYDILIGTQMVAKGLDFENVTLIGIMLADIGLHIPDFRSSERLFQMMVQVAGRCGRAKTEGEVILQTYNPNHPAIEKASRYAYRDFMEDELKLREKFGYPPFNHLIKFTIVGDQQGSLEKTVRHEQEILEDIGKTRSLKIHISSAPSMTPKVASQYYYHLYLRSENPSVIFSHWRPPEGWRVDIDPIHTA